MGVDMKRLTTFSSCFMLLTAMSSCRPYLKDLSGTHREIVNTLDHMQWYVDAYGFASISSPILVEPDSSFKFSPKNATVDYFFNTRMDAVNARSATSSQNNLSLSHLASASIDMLSIDNQQLKAESAAGRSLATSLQGIASSTPASQPGAIPATAGTGATAASASGLIAATKPLFTADTPKLSNEVRSALMSAAGDTAVSAILSLLGDPSKISKFADKQVMFGVTQVSVNPGWLTRQNFAADISNRVDVSFQPAAQMVYEAFAKASFPEDPIAESAIHDLQKCVEQTRKGEKLTLPAAMFAQDRYKHFIDNGSKGSLAVAAVSPMEEAQTLDLQSSWQRRRELALQISLALTYAGVKGAADQLAKWASQEQQDVQSRTSNIVVNSYNTSGGIFGFEVGPRLSASIKFDSAVAKTLERQTFPALLMFGVDKEDLRPRVKVTSVAQDAQPIDTDVSTNTGPENRLHAKQIQTPAMAKCELMEPRIFVVTETSWKPLVKSRSAVPMTRTERFKIQQEANQAASYCKKKDKIPCAELNNCQETKHACCSCKDKHKDDCAEQTAMLDAIDDSACILYGRDSERLRARLLGSGWIFTVPIQAVKESLGIKDKKVETRSEVKEIFPNQVQVAARQGGRATAETRVELVMVGTGLSKVDLAKIQPVSGNVTWVDDKWATKSTPGADLVGGTIRLRFLVSGNDSEIVFGLPIKDGSPDDMLKTPRLSVTVLPESSSTIVIKKEGGSETFTFSPDVSDEVKKTALEKDKPKAVSVKKDETTTPRPAK